MPNLTPALCRVLAACLTEAERDSIRAGFRIAAIASVRDRTGLSLLEARDVVSIAIAGGVR